MAKNKKSTKDTLTKSSYEEKIVNDFLIQFTYTILAAMVLLFLYKARMFKYGMSLGSATPTLMWILMLIFAVAGIISLVLNKTKEHNGYFITSIYMFISAGVMFVCIGFETIADLFRIRIPYYTVPRVFKGLFFLLALSIIIGLVVYFVRYSKIKK